MPAAPAASAPTIALQSKPKPPSVWIADEDGGSDLAALLNAAGIKTTLGGAPGANGICLVTPLGEDCTSAAMRLKLDPARTVAVDMLGRFKGRYTAMKNPLTSPETLGAAVAALEATGAPVTAINDSHRLCRAAPAGDDRQCRHAASPNCAWQHRPISIPRSNSASITRKARSRSATVSGRRAC